MTITASDPSTSPAPPTDAARPEARSAMLDEVEQRLTDFLAQQRAHWHGVSSRAAQPVDAIASLVGGGGKRLRPMFCLSGFLAAGGAPETAEGAAALDASAALELLQAFALIHDDVVDNSALRRGMPTVHVVYEQQHRRNGWQGEPRRFGEGAAILAGDLALVYADQLTTSFPAAARAVWDELRAEMIVGQHVDVAAAAEGVVDPGLSRWIAVCKSGRYTIHRPLLLGATLAGRPDLADAFETYGVALGEAFQLRDDLIDAFGSSGESGKPAGLDFSERKMTLLLALAAERDPWVRKLVGQGADGDPDAAWDADQLREALERTGVRAEVERTIDGLVERARHSIAATDLDPAWHAEFSRLAALVAYRTH